MSPKAWLLLCLVSSLKVIEAVDLIPQTTEVILCRSCGFEVTSSREIISMSSPHSEYSFNDTLFNKDEVEVHVFLTNLFLVYPVVSVTDASCEGDGEWQEYNSWFPGYRWRPCMCPQCGAYIGWVFEPVYPGLVEPSKAFHSLILSALIGETCKYDNIV